MSSVTVIPFIPQVASDLMSALLMPSLRRPEHLPPEFPSTILQNGRDPAPWPEALSEYATQNWKKAELSLPLLEGWSLVYCAEFGSGLWKAKDL